MLADAETLRHLSHRIAPLRDLPHRVTLKLFAEIRFAHDALLASKLGKKVSTKLGARHPSKIARRSIKYLSRFTSLCPLLQRLTSTRIEGRRELRQRHSGRSNLSKLPGWKMLSR